MLSRTLFFNSGAADGLRKWARWTLPAESVRTLLPFSGRLCLSSNLLISRHLLTDASFQSVIHTTAGTGSFVLSLSTYHLVAVFFGKVYLLRAALLGINLVMGKRVGFEKYHGEFPGSNLPFAAIGAALLWMGWFGFNAGSALTAGPLAVSAVASTQIAACASGSVWLLISAIRHKPSTVAIMNGVIAGLAGITPASGYIKYEDFSSCLRILSADLRFSRGSAPRRRLLSV